MLIPAAVAGIVSKLFMSLVVVGTLVLTGAAMLYLPVDPPKALRGRILVFSFLNGVAIYLFRDRIPHSYPLLLASVVGSVVCLSYAPLSYLASLPAGYLTVWIGVTKPPKIPFGDLSYGVYLFHFPVARTLWEWFSAYLSWWSLALVTLLITEAFAAVSWTLIEQPVLLRKKTILAYVDDVWMGAGLWLRARFGRLRN